MLPPPAASPGSTEQNFKRVRPPDNRPNYKFTTKLAGYASALLWGPYPRGDLLKISPLPSTRDDGSIWPGRSFHLALIRTDGRLADKSDRWRPVCAFYEPWNWFLAARGGTDAVRCEIWPGGRSFLEIAPRSVFRRRGMEESLMDDRFSGNTPVDLWHDCGRANHS